MQRTKKIFPCVKVGDANPRPSSRSNSPAHQDQRCIILQESFSHQRVMTHARTAVPQAVNLADKCHMLPRLKVTAQEDGRKCALNMAIKKKVNTQKEIQSRVRRWCPFVYPYVAPHPVSFFDHDNINYFYTNFKYWQNIYALNILVQNFYSNCKCTEVYLKCLVYQSFCEFMISSSNKIVLKLNFCN